MIIIDNNKKVCKPAKYKYSIFEFIQAKVQQKSPPSVVDQYLMQLHDQLTPVGLPLRLKGTLLQAWKRDGAVRRLMRCPVSTSALSVEDLSVGLLLPCLVSSYCLLIQVIDNNGSADRYTHN